MKKDWVDFKEVREKVSMASVLAHYGIKDQLEGKGEELRGKCPFHEGDGKRTLAVNLEKGLYYCFSCKAGGHVLDFAAAMDDSTIREAALKLQELFLGEGSEPNPKPKRQPKKEEPAAAAVEVINPPLGFELRVDPGHEYGQSRGVSREMLEEFGAGFCLSKGTFAGRFVFPLNNERGELIGYAGRSVDDSEPKYLFPSGEKGFQKRRVLWNFHREVRELGPDAEVIVVEGFFDLMRVREVGYPCVALMGSSISQEQEELLATYFKRVILMLDGDEAGRGATDECLKRLGRRMFVKALEVPDGKQPDMLSREEIVLLMMKGRAST